MCMCNYMCVWLCAYVVVFGGYVSVDMCGGAHMPVHMSRGQREMSALLFTALGPGIHCFSTIQAILLSHFHHSPGVMPGCWECELGSLCLHEKHS